MTWISFVCLLALTSAAFGYSLGRYSQLTVPELPVRHTLPSGTQYQSFRQAQKPRRLTFDLLKPATLSLSEADFFCDGKTPDLVTELEDGDKLIICTLEIEGNEIVCPEGLVYSDETKRCEYKVSVNENVCASQPCLNGGRCIPTQYSYQCDCNQGFSGRTCELDANVCQQQQPCGSSLDAVCQSFHVGSALKHVCVFEGGRVYGLTSAEAFPNPCLSGEDFHPLAFGNQGFIMCDDKRMFIQSCPGGTVWNSLVQACSWPDMEETVSSVVSVEAPAQRLIEVPSSESGGFSASLSSDADFTERLAGGQFQPAASRVSGGSSVDFTRRFEGGNFERTTEARGGIRGTTGFPFAGTPGASRNGRNQDNFDGPFIRGMSTDDSTSSSIRIPFRPSSSGNSEMERRGMLPSSFFGRPGEARRSS